MHAGTSCWAALAASLAVACGGPAPGPSAAPPEAERVPSPKSFVVQPDRVVIEGSWYPIDAGPPSTAIPNAVRVVCVRAERSCQEDLTRLSAAPGAEPAHELLQYRIEQWTEPGKRAGRLIASRREGAARIEIRVALRGKAAVKAVIAGGRRSRWRLE